MAGDVRIDWCPVDRVVDVQRLIGQYWKPGHLLARDRELLCWQHRHPNEAGRLSLLLATEGEDPVGMMGLIPVGFNLRGERRAGVWLALWLIAPEQRPQRLGLRLLQQVLAQGYEVVACLGFREETTRGIYQALQFEIWDQIPRWIGVICPERLDELLAGSGAACPREARQAWLAAGATEAALAPATGVRLREWDEETAARWDQAWRERFAPGLTGTWRDAAYLRWRYVDHPRFQYRVLFAEDGLTGSIAGLLVYRLEPIRERAASVLRVVEFLAAETAAAALARAVVEAGREAQVAFADFFCAAPMFARALEASGFIREDQMPAPLPSRFQPLDFQHTRLNGAFWIRPELRQAGSSPFAGDRLYVTRADGDQDRPN